MAPSHFLVPAPAVSRLLQFLPVSTATTSIAKPFQWSSEAKSAFLSLKERFSSIPILIQSDTSKQFIVEVDALDSGVGAVLSKWSSGPTPLGGPVIRGLLGLSPSPSSVSDL